MSVSALLSQLHGAAPLVAPSILNGDFGDLRGEVRRLEEAGARVIHLDVMDGHFVPNLSFGLPIVEAVRRATDLPLDVHLMISEPAKYASRFREAGADLLTFHIEAVPEPGELLDEIRAAGAAAGLSLNPPTPVSLLAPFLQACDLVLVMSVMPGFGGQKFDPVALEKLRYLRERGGEGLLLSIDGGVGDETIGNCAAAGAELFVVGTGLMAYDDYKQRLGELARLAEAPSDARV
jgi:ribulose-phosphate 3-epimerase